MSIEYGRTNPLHESSETNIWWPYTFLPFKWELWNEHFSIGFLAFDEGFVFSEIVSSIIKYIGYLVSLDLAQISSTT